MTDIETPETLTADAATDAAPEQPEAPDAPAEPTTSPSGEADAAPPAEYTPDEVDAAPQPTAVDDQWAQVQALADAAPLSSLPGQGFLVDAAPPALKDPVVVIDSAIAEAVAAGEAAPSEAEQQALTDVLEADIATEPVVISDNHASLLEARAALLVAAHNSLIEPETLTDAEYRAAVEYAASTAVVQATAEAPNQHPLAAYDPSFVLATGQIAGTDQHVTSDEQA